jgi:hypothetical protein
MSAVSAYPITETNSPVAKTGICAGQKLRPTLTYPPAPAPTAKYEPVSEAEAEALMQRGIAEMGRAARESENSGTY